MTDGAAASNRQSTGRARTLRRRRSRPSLGAAPIDDRLPEPARLPRGLEALGTEGTDQLHGDIWARLSVVDALAKVCVELARPPKEGGVKWALQTIADLTARSLGADVVTIYQYDHDRGEFLGAGTGPALSGAVSDWPTMQRGVQPGDAPWTVVKERRSGFYSDVGAQAFLAGQSPGKPGPRFIAREEIKSVAALLLPRGAAEDADEEIVGVMFASYRRPHRFDVDEISALSAFADCATLAISSGRREEQRSVVQLRMVESISAHLAHRLSNLAGTTRVNAQLLRMQLSERQDLHGHLTRIEHEADVMFQLAARLVRPFLGRNALRESVDIRRLLEEELRDVLADAKHVEVLTHLATGLPPVQHFEFQLRDVFRNLVDNALEAMSAQKAGTLTVRAYVNGSGDRVEVEVSDTGPGIPDEVREWLFAPGASTKRSHLGIGLWHSRSLMRATSGDVTLRESQGRGGATFLMEIPCVRSDSPGTPAPPAVAGLSLDVLLVEDAPEWRQILAEIVTAGGWSLHATATLEEALAVLRQSRFRLAVVDVGLPGETDGGGRLISALDALGVDTKVVIMSGRHDVGSLAAKHPNRILATVSKATLDVQAFQVLIRHALRSGHAPAGA